MADREPIKKRLADMRAASLRKPHGVRSRYVAGCRCAECRASNTAYRKQREQAQREGEWNGIVSAAKARAHLIKLSAQGVGYNQVASTIDKAPSILFGIKQGQRKRCRAETARLIMGVDATCIGDAIKISDAKARAQVADFLANGWTKTRLSYALGYKSHALQICRHSRITAANARKVDRLHARELWWLR